MCSRLAVAVARGRRATPRDVADTYSRVADDYDHRFLGAMGRHNTRMLDVMGPRLPPSPRVIDLACGTGFNSAYLAHAVGGTYLLSDLSEGMLAHAARRMPEAEVFQGDMLAHAGSLPDSSFDGAVCAWAIKYSRPSEVASELGRILVPGGLAAVIVNRRDTLPEVRRAFPRLMARHSTSLDRVLFSLPNPRGTAGLTRWFKAGGFSVVDAGDGEEAFDFPTGREAADWVASTGALAGFDVMVDLQDDMVRATLGELLHNGDGNRVTHRFVWGVFRNEK
jgi:ubiquinone/menaquinone biosynthesis C-methylase UbiE